MIYFLKDDRSPNHTPEDLKLKKRWHWSGGGLHIWMASILGDQYGFEWGLLYLSILWCVFDGFINIKVLNLKWWDIGTTAPMDKLQRKLANWLKIPAPTMSATLKCLSIAISVLLLIFDK